MASANLKSKISIDTTQFSAGLRRVKLASTAAAKQIGTSFRKLGSVMANLVKSLARFAAIAGGLTFAAAVAGAVKLGTALKKAFDAGGALSDLSAQTGIAVKQLVILQQAFKDNGLSADQAGSTINKLQRSISDFGAGLSTQVRAFERLGISFSDLEDKSPLEQFQLVQGAISRMENPTQKAATAMEIFGRSGGDMLALFADGNAIDNAMVTVGSAADLLDNNATKFDRISDLLGSAGSKLQGFFVGVADVVGDKILPILEKFNSIDFAAIGQKFAAGLNVDNAKQLLLGAMQIVSSFLGNKLFQVIRLAAEFGKVAFNHVFEKLSGEFGQKLKTSLLEVAKIAILPPPLQIMKLGQTLKSELQKSGEDGMTLEDKLLEAKDALKNKVLKDPDPFGFNAAVDDFKKNLDGVMEAGATAVQIKELKQKAARDVENEQETGSPGGSEAFFEETGPPAGLKNKRPAMTTIRTLGGGIRMVESASLQQSSAELGIPVSARDGMQNSMSANVFASDRKRLGIASGLKTGGLGAVKRVGAKAEQKQQRKDDTVTGTNERLTLVNEKLEKQNEMLQEALN